MKKLILSLSLAFLCGLYLQAQEEETTETSFSDDNGGALTNKKGAVILPQSGDYAFGCNATPFINTFGNLIKINSGGAFNSTAAFNFLDANNTIFGKYYVSSTMAYRGKVRIGMTNTVNKVLVDDLTSTDTPPPQVEDKQTIATKNILLGGGIEYRLGKSRLQGFYGGEALLGFATNKTSYKYGNALDSTSNYVHTTHSTSFGQTQGLVTNKGGTVFTFGLRGFIGAEYFFFPKLSVGSEFGWGINYQSTGKGKQVVETWESGEATETETETAGGSALNIDTDNFSGVLYLMFHF